MTRDWGDVDSRTAEAWRVLDTVLDPELDEPITSLRFVTRVAIDGDAVAVDFRLPTYWCSPNFAWIMAEDMRAVLTALPWTSTVTVTLAEHLFAAKINAAVNSGSGFGEAFADAQGDLTALRATFRRKAYLGRMATLVDSLRATGRSDTELLAMTVGELRALVTTADAGPTSPLRGGRGSPSEAMADFGRGEHASVTSCPPPEMLSTFRPPLKGEVGGASVPPEVNGDEDTSNVPALAGRYLELRAAFGGPCATDDPAFRTPEGEDIASHALPSFLRGVRMARRGVEANGEMCRIYLRERSTNIAADRAQREPEPVTTERR